MNECHTDVVVIGGGPGGYSAALRCSRAGLHTILVEEGSVGGTCLNVGCIPSKAVIHAADRYFGLGAPDVLELGISATPGELDLGKMMAWKDDIVGQLRSGVLTLLGDAGVERLDGWGTLVDGKTVSIHSDDGDVTVRAGHIVLATGSTSIELPSLPFDDAVISSSGVLTLTELPTSMVVVGGGYIGLELGTAFQKLGTVVTIIEMADRILPQFDPTLTRPVADRLTELGIDVHTNSKVCGPGPGARGVTLETDDGQRRAIDSDSVLVAVGRAPATRGWNLEGLDLEMNGQFVAIDDRCRTSMTGVYAIGDLTGDPMLAHRAFAQAAVVSDVIAGGKARFDHRAIPEVCFTDPEVFSIGYSPTEARSAGISHSIGMAKLRNNARALTLGRPDGFVRVVAGTDHGEVLGIQAVGTGVSELSAAATIAIEMGARIDDLTYTIQAHPTLGEAIQDAAHAAAARSARPPGKPR